MKLKKGDQIVTAYAESAAGPGWVNRPVWLIIQDVTHNFRRECLQPDEHGVDIGTLYSVSQAAHEAMTSAVRRRIMKK